MNGLDRSPAHLITTTKARWARVGIGISKDFNDVYYITQEFSTIAPEKKNLSKKELKTIEEQIID